MIYGSAIYRVAGLAFLAGYFLLDLSPVMLLASLALFGFPILLSNPSDPKPARCTCERRGTALGCPQHGDDPGNAPRNLRCTCGMPVHIGPVRYHAPGCPSVNRPAGDDLDRLTREYRDGSLGTLDYLLAVDALRPDVTAGSWHAPKTRSKVLEDPSKGIVRIWQQEPLTDATRASLETLMRAKQSAKGNAGRTVVLESCGDCETVMDATGVIVQTFCTRNCRPGPSGP